MFSKQKLSITKFEKGANFLKMFSGLDFVNSGFSFQGGDFFNKYNLASTCCATVQRST